jgi:hypothetical protein
LAEIPERLRRLGRPVDPNFSAAEKLFRRIPPRLDHIVDGKLLPPAIKFPDFSVNREKYSQPADVLLGVDPDGAIRTYPDHGIAAFEVGDVPLELKANDGEVYTFKVLHEPLDENYSHSEVRTYVDGNRSQRVPQTIKSIFRSTLFAKIVVLKQPAGLV